MPPVTPTPAPTFDASLPYALHPQVALMVGKMKRASIAGSAIGIRR